MNLRNRLFLSAVSGTLLACAYPPFNWELLGWVCFVPFLWALKEASGFQTYLAGLVLGICGIFIGFSWVAVWAEKALGTTTLPGVLFLIGFSFSFAQLFGVMAVLLRWLKLRTGFDDLFLFPLALVAVFTLFPLLFPFRLGDSQWRIPLVLQPIDMTGISGLDFTMALSNSLIFCLLSGGGSPGKRWGSVAGGLIILVWLGTGWGKWSAWEREIDNWPDKKIGIVQPNRPPALSKPRPEPGFSRLAPLEMILSKPLAAQGADLLIWPEGHFFGYTFWSRVREAFTNTIRNWQTPLVFYDATRRTDNGSQRAFNTAIFLDADGQKIEHYDKIKLVPFSEYLPVLNHLPLFGWILGEYLDTLTPGTETKVVALSGMKLVPKICYEPLFPGFVAQTIGEDGAGKVIIVQSQDGWFGKTGQPFQHMAVTVMRAVENRVPLVHVIQNGPSGVIAPSGRIQFLSEAFSRGSWLVEMPFHPERGGSFYSRYPMLFDTCIRIVCLLLIGYGLYRTHKRTR